MVSHFCLLASELRQMLISTLPELGWSLGNISFAKKPAETKLPNKTPMKWLVPLRISSVTSVIYKRNWNLKSMFLVLENTGTCIQGLFISSETLQMLFGS